MAGSLNRLPLLEFVYQQFLDDRDAAAFIRKVSARYAPATLERLLGHPARLPSCGSLGIGVCRRL
ncbi:MAG: hypothetical protein QM775_13945 [Pirellulales bacterium]